MMRENNWMSCLRTAFFLLTAGLIAGCAGVGGNHFSGMDANSLLNAIDLDDAEAVRAAVRRNAVGINQSIPAPAYSAGAPLIALAARAGSLQVLRYLISAGADLNARTSAGETPLMLASYFHGDEGAGYAERHDQAVRMLIEAGAVIENDRHHYTPLAYAAYNNRQAAVRYLIERGARVDADASGRVAYINTPLIMAAIQGHREIVRTLLRAGADPLVRVHLGNTARELAIKYRHTHIEPLLACAESVPHGGHYARHCENKSVAVTY